MVARKPAPNVLRKRPVTADPPRTELSTVDFSGADSSLLLPGATGHMEVHEGVSGLGALYEEAAVLYANGNSREAQSILEAATNDTEVITGIGVWMMLLDLYQLTGQRELFETRVLDYARRFERSPPPWDDLSGARPSRKAETVPLINLSGNLCAQSAQQFQQTRLIGHRSGALRLDFRRLKGVDDEGCRLFMELVRFFARERVKLHLLNASQLIQLLQPQVEVGVAEGRERWLTLLECLQFNGDQELFEEHAINYAITFEESPPSWESRETPVPRAHAVGTNTESAEAESEGVVTLEGELNSASSESIRNLAASATPGGALEVDCTRLRRMDFVSAGMLFNVLSVLSKQSSPVTLRNVNAMVAALWRVMGIDKVASVTLRL